MLLSMLMSFIFTRKFRANVRLWLIVVCLIPISFFSVGIPEHAYYVFYSTMETGLFIWNPLPLSFPIYALVVPSERTVRQVEALWYRLYFLHLVIQEDWMLRGSLSREPNFTVFEYLLYYSFFMLINIGGAVAGYWLNGTTFNGRLLKKTCSKTEANYPKT